MASSIKILHLENEDANARLVKEELKKGNFPFEYQRAKDTAEFEKKLHDFSPDIVIANDSLKPSAYQKNIYSVRNSTLTFELIIIANTYSEKTVATLLKSGVADFLFKDRLERLPLAVLNAASRSKSEKQLREQQEEALGNEKKFKTLIENISDAILLLDVKGTITYQSPSAERISGFLSSQVIGKSIFEFIHPAELQTATRFLKQAILKPALSLPTSYRIRKKRGSFIWVEGTITNFLHDESVKAIIIDYRNITEHIIRRAHSKVRS